MGVSLAAGVSHNTVCLGPVVSALCPPTHTALLTTEATVLEAGLSHTLLHTHVYSCVIDKRSPPMLDWSYGGGYLCRAGTEAPAY